MALPLQMRAWEKQQDAIKAAKKAGLSKKKAEDKAKDDKAKKGTEGTVACCFYVC